MVVVVFTTIHANFWLSRLLYYFVISLPNFEIIFLTCGQAKSIAANSFGIPLVSLTSSRKVSVPCTRYIRPRQGHTRKEEARTISSNIRLSSATDVADSE